MNKKVNIAHIYPNIKRMHGATKWLMLFVTKLTNKGTNNTIFCPIFIVPLPYWFEGKIHPLFRNNKKVDEYIGARKLVSILLQLIAIITIPLKIPSNIEVFVLHSELSLFAFPIIKLKHRGKKIIYYCYQPPRELYDLSDSTKTNYGISYFLLLPFLYFYKKIDRRLVKECDNVLVWSKEAADYARSIYGNLPYEYIPAGIDFSVFENYTPQSSQVEQIKIKMQVEDKFILLMNAALTPKKNIPLFITLVKKILEKNIQVCGIIIGQGPEKDSLEKEINRLDLNNNIILAGYVSQEELPLYYHMAKILYYLEDNGIWTMSTIEAGAARIPVIVTPGGSMKTLVLNNVTGFILNKDDIENDLIAKTMFLACNDEEREKMGKSNYEHSRNFAADMSAEKFIETMLQ